MPRDGVFHHLEEHRAVAGGPDLELVQQLNCTVVHTTGFHVPFIFLLRLRFMFRSVPHIGIG